MSNEGKQKSVSFHSYVRRHPSFYAGMRAKRRGSSAFPLFDDHDDAVAYERGRVFAALCPWRTVKMLEALVEHLARNGGKYTLEHAETATAVHHATTHML